MTGKVYALSDLHGHYEALCAMLKKIHFCDNDRLYILGDCNDRGRKPWKSTTSSANIRTTCFS